MEHILGVFRPFFLYILRNNKKIQRILKKNYILYKFIKKINFYI